jgi:hypothetical protein
MSKDQSVHPLDLEDDDDYEVVAVRKQPLTNKQSALKILGIIGVICLVLTVGGAVLINSSPDSSTEQIGELLRQVGGFGMLFCCLALLAVIRSEKLVGFLSNKASLQSKLKSPWLSLLIRSLGAFISIAILLSILHLTLGSPRAIAWILFPWPIYLAVILALVGSTQQEYRAYWIGFATAILLGFFGFSMNLFMLTYFGGNPYGNTPYRPGALPPANVLYGSPMNYPGSAPPGYTFEYRILLSQLSTIGWAMFNGLICSAVVAWALPNRQTHAGPVAGPISGSPSKVDLTKPDQDRAI